MEVKICDFCGTEFDAELAECPLCGKASAQTVDPEQQPPVINLFPAAAADMPEEQYGWENTPKRGAQPQWFMIALCSVLGAAVLAGAVFAVSQLGWFMALLPEKETAALPALSLPVVEEPVVSQEPSPATPDRYTNEEDYVPEEEPAEEIYVNCTSLTLSTGAVTFEEPEQFFNISYSREPEGCMDEVTFTSSDESVATVNQQGKIVAVNAGSAIVTATCGGQTQTCLVTCDFSFIGEENGGDALPMELNSVDMTLFYPGEQAALYVKNKPNDETVTYSSEDPSIASISGTGVITAEGSGTTTVTAVVDDQILSCIVRCNLSSTAESDETVNMSFKLSHSDVTMSIQNEYFRISLQDGNGDSISGVSWKSTDPKVCTVDSTGIVTAIGHGTAYIQTTYNGVTYQCIVRCNI